MLGMHISHARVSQTGMLIRVLELKHFYATARNFRSSTWEAQMASPDTLKVTSISKAWWKEDKPIPYNAERLPAYSEIPTGMTNNRQVGKGTVCEGHTNV